jgi:thiol-disulfide isomerase/thioredoxin
MVRRFVMPFLLASAGLLMTGATPGGDSLRSLDGGSGWINSPPLTASDLRGKVVLVDFWEYTCINCLRTLPYLKAWYERYRDHGFVIVGVHTPEFGFSGDGRNVADAVKRLGITWPVVLDDKNAIWNRWKNNSWPHEYLYDQSGALVDVVDGEGQYPQTEAKIQGLLKAQNASLSLPPVMALLPQDSYDKPGARCYPHTPEMLLEAVGIANSSASNNQSRAGTFSTIYSDGGPPHKDGSVYLQGPWHATDQYVTSAGPGHVAISYRAIQVVSVLRPVDTSSVRVNIIQDGKPVPKDDAGSDIRYDGDGTSYITVNAPREYDIVMNAQFGQHELSLQPAGSGLGVYSFAFEACEIPG